MPNRLSVTDIEPAVRGWLVEQRARVARRRHADLGEISVAYFYATRLRFRDLAFDIGANRGTHTAAMLRRGARVVAVEPQAHLAQWLTHEFPAATVLALGVSDQRGEARLVTSENEHLATLNPAFPGGVRDTIDGSVEWGGEETIELTTLDDLISEYGLPSFAKIDTEGLDDRVLAGLNHPIEQLMFEVLSGVPDVAERCFARLAELGNYEYRLMAHDVPGQESWVLSPPTSSAAILAALPRVGDVYARCLSGTRGS